MVIPDKSADIKIEWNVQIPMLVLIKQVKTKDLLSYRGTFLCNVLEQTHYTSESPVRYCFIKKL